MNLVDSIFTGVRAGRTFAYKYKPKTFDLVFNIVHGYSVDKNIFYIVVKALCYKPEGRGFKTR
jgi:hypothetical protein